MAYSNTAYDFHIQCKKHYRAEWPVSAGKTSKVLSQHCSPSGSGTTSPSSATETSESTSMNDSNTSSSTQPGPVGPKPGSKAEQTQLSPEVIGAIITAVAGFVGAIGAAIIGVHCFRKRKQANETKTSNINSY